MKKREHVSKIMTKELASVNTTQSLKEVNELLASKNIRHIPVVSGSSIVGLISSTDIQKISFVSGIDEKNVSTAMFDALSIEQVMTKNIKTVQEDDTILDVAVILSENEFHALPVLSGDKLVGIVTTTDLVKYLIEQY